MALCVKADIELFLQLTTDTIADALSTQLIAGAQAAMELEVRHPLEAGARTATLDGLGSDTIFLPIFPLNSVTSVVEDGVTLVEDTDFYAYREGRLVRASDGKPKAWVRALQAIVVIYNAGYTAVPEDLRDLCIRVVARAYQAGLAFAATADAAGVRQETIDNYSVTYGSAAGDVASAAVLLSAEDRRQLRHYRRRRSSVKIR